MEGSALGKHKLFLFSFVTPTFGCFFQQSHLSQNSIVEICRISSFFIFLQILTLLHPFFYHCFLFLGVAFALNAQESERDCCFPVPSQLLSLTNRFLNLILLLFSPLHANGPWSYLSVLPVCTTSNVTYYRQVKSEK